MPPTPSDRYTTTAIRLHWLLALLLIAQVAFGYYLGEVPRGTPARTIYVNMHKTTGLIFGLLILYRLYWRLTHRAPPLPDRVPALQQKIAGLTHVGLYLCMLVLPISGYVASNYSKFGVKLFNSWTLPPWGPDDKAIYGLLNTTHKTAAIVFVVLVVVHVLGAVKHLLARDTDLLRRMLPGLR
jgi:cytochrome b561